MASAPYPNRTRLAAGLPTLILHLLIGLALIYALGGEFDLLPPDVTRLVDVSPVPPPPAVRVRPPARERSRRREGAASPPNIESRRTDIVTPPPPAPVPPPVVTAPAAGTGVDPTAGAAPIAGPGTGSGGQGTGTGSGANGDGLGGGGDGDGDGGGFTPPRHVRGTIRDSDYPRAAGAAGISGRVSVIYAVETDGRVTHCAITHSSGSAELDATTCRLIEERFRFTPSRDRFRRPVRSRVVQDHIWEAEDEPAQAQEPVRRRRRLF